MKRHLSLAALGICFFALNTSGHAQEVKADTGGVAIGRDLIQSTIIIGIPQEKVGELVREAKRPLDELTAQLRESIALLKEKLDLNERQVRAALGILGENDIPPERLAAKLVEIAERFKDLRATASAQPGDSPTIVSLKAEAQKAIEAGELDKADALLADVETEESRASDRLNLNRAETSARRGEIALTRLRYVEAASHFGSAAAVVSSNSAHEDKWIGYLSQEAEALYLQGKEFGDNEALRAAVERLARLIALNLRERMPAEWAETQNHLGVTLTVLGERESDRAKLEDAAVAFREALKEYTRERAPLYWAMIQNNLGNALTALGQRDMGPAKLQQAVAAFRETLKVRTRERSPLDWAQTQNNLGGVLSALGKRGGGTAKFEEALVAFREALKETTRERAPLQWAMIQNNVGVVVFQLAGREAASVNAQEAVIAFREALKVYTRERVPLKWAETQVNLGNTLALLGVDDKGKLEEVIVAYREALKELTRERAPLRWADIQNNVGTILFLLGESERGTAKLEEAVLAFGEALKVRTRDSVPLDWATSLGGQGMALTGIAERRKDRGMANTALKQINIAFETMRDAGNAPGAAFYEQHLAKARAVVARLRGR